ncbi:MAG: hypothetical protein ACJ8F7_17020, partial [Gemmataceae bacterium]
LMLAQETLTEEKRRTEAAGARNDRLFYTHLLASADRNWLMYDAGGALQDLEACAPALRGWEWRLLRRQVEGARLTAAAPPLTALTVLPGDREFAGLASDGVLHIWELATAGHLRLQPLQRGADFPPAWLFSRGTFSPDGRLLAAVCQPQESAPKTCRVGVWRVGTGELVRSWDSPAALVIRLAFNPAATRLAWSSGAWQESRGQACWTGGEVRVLDPDTGLTTLQFDSGEFSFPDLAFSPDGKWLATTGRHVALFVFDAQTGAKAVRLDEPNFLGRGVVYQDGGRRILVLRDHELTLFASGGERLTPANRERGGIDRLFASPDATRVATADSLNTVRVFDSAASLELAHLAGHTRWVMLAAFTADNQRLVTFSPDGHLKVWDLNREPGPRTLGRGDIVPGEWVPCAVFDHAGGRLYTASDKKLIRVFDTKTGEKLFTLTAAHEVRSLALSPDGRRLAVGYDDVNGRIGVWDLKTKAETVWPAGHRDSLTCVVYSADGTRLATASQDGTAKLWEAATGRLLAELRGHAGYVNYVAFHPDGRQAVTAGEDGTVRFWDGSSGQALKTLAAHDSAVTVVAFSPDGREMATANHNRDKPTAATQIHLWDVATGERRATLTGHHQSIWHLAYSADGSRLASAGEDHTVRLWDPTFGELRLTLKWHSDDVRYVAFSPDGRLLVSCGDDPFIRLWDATP